MAERKAPASGGIAPSPADIERCVAFHDSEKERAEDAAENARAALEPLAEKGMRLDALKAAMRLRKLEPLARQAWFESFGAACSALDLDAQYDMFASPSMPRAAGGTTTPGDLN
jgi:hypothetical protein